MRKTHHKIAAAYDASAWVRLTFILIGVAIGNLGAWLVFGLLGDGLLAACVVVVWLLSVSWAAALILVPSGGGRVKSLEQCIPETG